MQLPTDLAPAQRSRVEAFLVGVTPVADHPEHTAPETGRSRDRCALCPRRTGVLTVFRLDPRDDHGLIAHLSCRRRALRKRRLQQSKIIY